MTISNDIFFSNYYSLATDRRYFYVTLYIWVSICLLTPEQTKRERDLKFGHSPRSHLKLILFFRKKYFVESIFCGGWSFQVLSYIIEIPFRVTRFLYLYIIVLMGGPGFPLFTRIHTWVFRLARNETNIFLLE